MNGQTLGEEVESLFNLKISSSGADITINFGDDQATVPYERFAELRDNIEDLALHYAFSVLNKLDNSIFYYSANPTGQEVKNAFRAHQGYLVDQLRRNEPKEGDDA